MSRKRPEDLRSHRWFGVDDIRAFGHRSRMLQAGYAEADFRGKPVIGIINTWSELSPCHFHFRTRAEEVKRGVWQAGGFPVELPAHPVTEQYQKPTCMLYRNLLAMETEELARSHPCDGLVLLGGCDKTPPGLMMGAISAGLPSIMVPAGPMLRGNWRGKTLGSGSDVWKYHAELRAGNITQDAVEGHGGRHRAVLRHLHDRRHGGDDDAGGARRWASRCPARRRIPAADSAHPRMATETGRRIVEMVWEDATPQSLITEGSVDNAVTAAMAFGGSTNAIPHLIAMARRAGRDAGPRALRRAVAPRAAGGEPAPECGRIPDGGFLLRRRRARLPRAHPRLPGPLGAHRDRPHASARTSPAPRCSTTA